jgi:hypothetical protein
MSQILECKAHPELLRVIRAADSKYKKHKAILVVSESVTLSGTYWDGGSRSSYCAVNLETLRVGPAPQYNPPQFGGPRSDPKCDIPVGVVIVKLGTFCGKQATATLYVHPENVAKLLPGVQHG